MKTIPMITYGTLIALTAFSFTSTANAADLIKAQLTSKVASFPITMEPVKGNQSTYVPPNRQPVNQSVVVEALNRYSRPETKAVVPGIAQPAPAPLEVEKPKPPVLVIEDPAAPEAPVEVVETHEPSSAPSSPPVLTKAERRAQVKECVAALPAFPDLSGMNKAQRNQAIRDYKAARFDGVNTCLVASGFPPKEPKNKSSGAGSSMSADAEIGSGSSSDSSGTSSASTAS